jgi:dolichol-phosphate mannosyltransferase
MPTPSDSARDVSILVPTLNEADNVEPLLQAIVQEGRAASLDFEVIVIDDGSTDGTRDRVCEWEKDHPVRLLARDKEGGLAGAVLAGARLAVGGVVLVMDADLSHPSEKVAALIRPVLDGSHDMVIGSRYVPGGSTPCWPLSRRIVSRGAAVLARPFTAVRDPLSGFFAVRRDVFLEMGQGASGFKIGLEVLVRGGKSLRVLEVPITFRDRAYGKSKLGSRVLGVYLLQLARLAGLVLFKR